MKNKKGISPLIATVLIIGLTIVLAALVIAWVSGFFQSAITETELEAKLNLMCTGFDYSATAVRHDSASPAGSTDDSIELEINNKNDQSIHGFYFIAKRDSNARPFITDRDALETTTTVYGDIQGTDISGLDPFQTKSYVLLGTVGVTPAYDDEVEVRAIASERIEGPFKVCSNERVIKVVG